MAAAIAVFVMVMTVQAVGPTPSRSPSLGSCPSCAITSYAPYPPDESCGYCISTGTNEQCFCEPTLPQLQPSSVSMQLSGAATSGCDGMQVAVAYNFSYYHDRQKKHGRDRPIRDCMTPYNDKRHDKPPYIKWATYGEYGDDCFRICVVFLTFEMACPLSSASGTYIFEIPGVGEIPFDMSICLNAGANDDYGVRCDTEPKKCNAFTVADAAVRPTADIFVLIVALALSMLLF